MRHRTTVLNGPYSVFTVATTAGPTGQEMVAAKPARAARSSLDQVGRIVRAVRDYYREPVAWLVLVVTGICLCYIAGAAMFWFHAIALGEGGPAIDWYAHWLLDSTFAFVALMPVLLFIIPFAAWAAHRVAGQHAGRRSWLYVVVAGGLFSLVTVPGPLAHDLFVARGTWIADRATEAFGDASAPLTPAVEYPLLATLAQQLGAGILIYLPATAAALLFVRAIMARRAHAAEVERRAIAQGRRARNLVRGG